MDANLSCELETLTRFAQDLDGRRRAFPERVEFMLEGGRGYMKGALDLLLSLRLISGGEHHDWLLRPDDEMTGSSTVDPQAP